MVNEQVLVGAGVGEEVTGDVVRRFQGFTTEQLIKTLRRGGQSSQRKALLQRVIASREAGIKLSEAEAKKGLAEKRTIVKVQKKEEKSQQDSTRKQFFPSARFIPDPRGPLDVPTQRRQISGESISFIPSQENILVDLGGPIPTLTEEEQRPRRITERETISEPTPIISSEAFGPPELSVEPVRKREEGKEPSLISDISEFISGGIREREIESSIGEMPSIFGGLALGFGSSFITSAEATRQFIKQPLKTTEQIIRNIPQLPSQISQAISRGFEDPSFGVGFLGGEVSQALLGGKALRFGGDLFQGVRTRLDPRFIPFSEDVGTLGGFRNIPSQFGDSFDIKFAGPVSQLSEPLEVQAKLAGTKVTGVSAQISFPGFDIPLERTFFAEPRGKLRVSRLDLGIQKKASVLDVLSGDFTFTRGKRQALVFEKAQIEAFPSSLIDIETSLKTGRSLSTSQTLKLRQFQETPSGQFKPIGFLSKEPEITLPTSEIIRRGDFLGVSLVRGKRVEIIGASLDPSSSAKILSLQLDDISKSLSKQLKTGLSSRPISPPPFLSPTSFLPSSLSLFKSFLDSGFSPRRSSSRLSRLSSGFSPKASLSSLSPRNLRSDLSAGFSKSSFSPISPKLSFGSPIRTTRSAFPITFIPPPIDFQLRDFDTKPSKVKKGKKKKRRAIIRPSLTGIIQFDFGDITGPLPTTTVISGVDIGILPSRIRRRPR